MKCGLWLAKQFDSATCQVLTVTTTTTMDANLNHCLATGESLTGCLHFVNKTPVDWYSKKQSTVEIAT